jgi:hypothetical protein
LSIFFCSRGKWKEWDHIIRLAPDGWKEQNGLADAVNDLAEEIEFDSEVVKQGNKNWARLIQKVYEVDPLICPECGSKMKVIAVITDRCEAQKILKHLVKTGNSPPGLDEACLDG